MNKDKRLALALCLVAVVGGIAGGLSGLVGAGVESLLEWPGEGTPKKRGRGIYFECPEADGRIERYVV